MSLSTPARINQSRPPTCGGVGRADDGGEGEAVGGGGGGGGEGTGAAVILKGCEQVATPPARTLQHRNSGNFIRRRQQQQQQRGLQW